MTPGMLDLLRRLAGLRPPRLLGACLAVGLLAGVSAEVQAGLILPDAATDGSLSAPAEAAPPDLSWLFEPPVPDDVSSEEPGDVGGPAAAYRGREDAPPPPAVNRPSSPRPVARVSPGGRSRRPVPPPGGVFRPPRGVSGCEVSSA